METIKTYKLLRRDEVGLHPLFIDKFVCLPMGEWIEARAPNDIALQHVGTGFALIDLQRQRPLLMQDQRPRRNQIAKATRDHCRWVEVSNGKVYDIGLATNGQVLRFAHRPGWHTSLTPSLPAVSMEGKVWAECLIPADDYYTLHRNISGLSQMHEPIDWLISQKLFIVRLLE